ncbi:DUF982 domain-containing protein [Cupriavidus necator]|uniref:Uncharacterized protein n=1 Tax=Cupriavidus necator (strain ATCC 17699 / DSM 428 / KCTC 22496 / NCIMB 10442 / H16 / Stanier 337) TaxID=381666 RepID=Q0JZW4_CUPNH|nr:MULTISPECIES: hypothetical protein [Cupriavidus]EON18074.1 hypothetical protein C265_19969 [Cupriavidus sp. GA3-3]KUE90773.1 hypothetical protein ASL20_01180 [Cupriavidus necator]QCC04529.1 hypothetical protein E6A55_28935 [Cupriavidus necator H16]QQB79221.1 hypothetical protein I6H87_28510 [Cupriavidus necator]WKA43443.1 hypothetical protein QWP09_28985 [Cupriavidus necator]
MDIYPAATYKGYDLYPLVYKHAAERVWPEPRPDRSFDAAVVICLEGESPEGMQARTFRLDAAPWDNVGGARRGALRYAEAIINGAVPGVSVIAAGAPMAS